MKNNHKDFIHFEDLLTIMEMPEEEEEMKTSEEVGGSSDGRHVEGSV